MRAHDNEYELTNNNCNMYHMYLIIIVHHLLPIWFQCNLIAAHKYPTPITVLTMTGMSAQISYMMDTLTRIRCGSSHNICSGVQMIDMDEYL